MTFNYPLDIRFKLVALAPRMSVSDTRGQSVCFVSQKVFKLKEDIQVFQDESRSRELYRIRADKIFDFTTTYHFTDSSTGQALGAIKSQGWTSIWRATYEVMNAEGVVTHRITEDNPWIKIIDSLVSQIEIVGIFTGFFLHPSYSAQDVNTAAPDIRLKKESGLFEGRYSLNQVGEVSTNDEIRLMLSFMLIVQFMRRRG
ncbi:MAG: hypothetical protein SGJ24_07730 [Chloroflexota bacterium]|nr:hypothetical protein [Chloroflexota bacterium]